MPDTPSTFEDSATHLAAIRAGDSEAWRALFVAYFDELVLFAARYVGSGATAEDVVQSIFATLWERREQWAPESVRAYLYGATRNRALHAVARETTVREYAESMRSTGVMDGATSDAAPDADDDMSAHVGVLTERQRSALVLRFERDFTHQEIATTLGISLRGAEQLVARAIRALRERMGGGHAE
jgi:RNA polymerase sigma-70 factor (ECF subfamily)